MLRSAEEILREGIGLIPFATMNPSQGKAILEAIRQAQREAIEEVADRVEIEWDEMSIKSTVLSLLHEIK